MKIVTPLVFYQSISNGYYTVEKLNFMYSDGDVKLIWNNTDGPMYLYDSRETIVHDILMTLKTYDVRTKKFTIEGHKFYNILLINIHTLSIEQFSINNKNDKIVKSDIKEN